MYRIGKIIILLVLIQISYPGRAQQDNTKFVEAQNLFDKKDYKGARKILSELIKMDDKNPDLYLLRAKCYTQMLEYQDAFDDYNLAVKNGGMESKYFFERGLFCLNFQKFSSDAIDNFTMAKNYSTNDSMIYKCFYYRGYARTKIRDFDNAIEDYRNAFKINSKDTYLLNDIAMCYSNMNQEDSAIVKLEEAIKIDSNFIGAYQNIGFIYSGMGKYTEALGYFDKCIKMDEKGNSFLFNNRGFVKMKLNDYKGAMKDINKSLSMDKTNSYAYKNRALLYIELGETKKACEDLNKALELNYTINYGDEVKMLVKRYCN